MTFLKSIDRLFARIEGWFIILFLWVMVILTFLQVFLRSLYTHANLEWANTLMGYMDWSEPLVRLLVLWVSFLGASLLTQENKHIKIDLFSTLLPARWLPLREFILSLVCTFIAAVMCWVCIRYLRVEMDFGGQLFATLPNWVGQLILPVGFGVILFRFSLRALDQGLRMRRGIPK
jgi:TRAP-type C4-dicarboxylate transport system permease small subunit